MALEFGQPRHGFGNIPVRQSRQEDIFRERSITPGFGFMARKTLAPGFDRSDFSEWGGMSGWGGTQALTGWVSSGRASPSLR